MDDDRALGQLVDGGYVPGPDGRRYGDLSEAERIDVIQAHYVAIREVWAEEKKRLREEVDLILALPTKSERTFHMELVRAQRPNHYETLAAAVRAEYARRRGASPLTS